MKKIYLFGLTMVLALVGLSSCGSDELTDSRLTYYAVLEMQGDDFITVAKGTSYTDPGCKATLGGEDYTDHVITTGVDEVDVNTVGFYDITYSASNADGFSASASRTVCVYDPDVTLDMEGTYSADMDNSMYGAPGKEKSYADRAAYYGITTECVGITFTKELPGIYYVNDIFAGWYSQIRGYGSRYAMTGYVSLDNDGNIELLSSYIAGWGDGVDYIIDGHFDEATNTISYFVSYAGQIYMSPVLIKDAE